MSTIVTRAGKGSPLTHTEVDNNFTNLNTDKVEASGGTLTDPTINGSVSTSGLNFDSDTLVIDATNNRVGIGASSPGQKLEVAGAITSSGALTAHQTSKAIVAFNSGYAEWRSYGAVGTVGGHYWYSGSGGSAPSNVMTLDPSGNLGLGVTPSAWNSSVKAIDLPTNGYVAAANYLGITANAYEASGGTFTYRTTDFANLYQQYNGVHSWHNAPTGTAGNAVTFTQAMTLDASGNYMLGRTSSSSYRMQVTGSSDLVDIAGTSVSAQFHNKTADVFMLGVGSGDSIAFATNGNTTERMRIDTSGNVGIGVTPSAWYSNITALQVGNRYGSIFGGSGYSSAPNISVAANTYAISSTGVDTYIATAVASKYTQGNGTHAWYTAPSGTAGNAISFTQAMTLDSSGRLLVGATSSRAIDGTSNTLFQIEGVTGSSAYTAASIIRNANDTAGSWYYAGKSRGTTVGSSTAVVSGDSLGGIAGVGADGTDINNPANAIRLVVDGTVSTGIVPGRIQFETANTSGTLLERARITSDGYLRLSSNALGIQFGGDTAAANALDDYEEGTFTPTIVGTTTAGTGTYTAQSGRYTKIGNRVCFQIYLAWSAHTGTGNMRVSGLPFTASSAANSFSAPSFWSGNIALTANNYMQGYVNLNTTQINLEQVATGGGTSTSVAIDTAGQLMVSGQYEV